MSIQLIKKLLLPFLLLSLSLTMISCTSSDDDTTVLEDELDDIDTEANVDFVDGDEIEDIEDIAEDDLVDELDEEDSSDGEFADNEDDEDDEDDDEVADNDDDFDDFDDEDGDDEIADNDNFDDFDEEGDEKKKDFAQNEQSLEEELNQKPEDYPVAENAQPAFPEEVMGQNNPMDPVPANDGTITSETQEIALVDPNTPELPQDDLGAADPIVPLDDEVEAKVQSWVPVVKIKTDPFFRNQRLMNAVYIARPQDNIEAISQKIYGADKTSAIRADNDHLSKGVDPGDKVYYNSPNRPDDKTILKVYYDDVGLKPQSYQTSNGDNMRRLGSKLLGFPDGWKEIWAINPNIDSKTILPGGVNITYWTGQEENVMQMAEAETSLQDPPQDPPMVDEMASMGQVEELTEPELPPEPPLPEAEIAMPENSLEPEMVPDIEPFPEQGVEETPTPVMAAQSSNDSLLSIGAMALLLIAGVGLVAIQIKKRKDMTGVTPQSLEYTQV